MQALINGEVSYMSVNELMHLAITGDDFNSSFKSMVESVVAHGEKVQLSIDMDEYLKKEMSLDELKAMVSGEAPDGLSEDDEELFSYIQSTLDIDYSVLYQEALASQPGSTPTSEPPSKSVDDWM